MRLLLSTLVFLILAFQHSKAQEDIDKFLELSLDELLDLKVETVTKVSQNASEAPATVYIITSSQIKDRNYQSLLDVLKDIPGFKIDNNSDSERNNYITTRGIHGQGKFIILLDGAKISAPTNEPIPIFENYPVHFAKQIEIVLGPASAIYGADAVAGVINIITKSPVNLETPLYILLNGGMYNTFNTSLYYGKRISQDINLLLAGQFFYDGQPDLSEFYENEFKGINDLKTGIFNTVWGKMEPSAAVETKYDMPKYAYSLYSKLEIDDFKFNIFKNYDKVPSSTGYAPENAVYNDDVYFSRSILMAGAVYEKQIENIFSKSSFTYSSYEILPETNYRNIFSNMEPGYKYASSSMIKLEEQLTWRPNEKITITGGVSFEKYSSIPRSNDLQNPADDGRGLQAKIRGTNIDAIFYVVKYNNVGTYLQLQYKVSDKVSLTLGSRYDYNTRYKSTINPRLSFVYSPSLKTNIKILYGTAFLAPSPNITFSRWGSFHTDDGSNYYAPYLHVPNPDLKPLKMHTAEINIQQYFSNNISITVTGYYTLFNDLFGTRTAMDFFDPVNKIFRYRDYPVTLIEQPDNIGKQNIYGGTLKLDYLTYFGVKNKISAFLALTYTYGEVDQNEDGTFIEIPYIAPISIKAGMELTINNLTLFPRVLYLNKQNSWESEGAITRKTTSGYLLTDLSIRYKFNSNFSGIIKISNLFDARYKSVNYFVSPTSPEIPGGSPQNPIRFVAGIDLNF